MPACRRQKNKVNSKHTLSAAEWSDLGRISLEIGQMDINEVI